MTTAHFDEFERLINYLQISQPSSSARPLEGQPVSLSTNTEGLPDHNTAVSSSSGPIGSPGNYKQQIRGSEEKSQASSSVASTKPKRGKVNGFFPPAFLQVHESCRTAGHSSMTINRSWQRRPCAWSRLIRRQRRRRQLGAQDYTPLTSAIHSDISSNQVETVRLLLDNGTSITAKDAILSLPHYGMPAVLEG